MKSRLIGLLVATVIIVSPFAALAQSNPQSIEELQSRISYLTEQIRRLQGQTSTGTGTTQWCFTFDRNLGVGASGRDVRELYTALGREGFSVASVESTSNSNIVENNRTERYTESMAATVSQFQQKYANEILTPNGLSAPTGYFGNSTRAKINSLYGCSGQQPIPYYQGSFMILSPHEGGVWPQGETRDITWTYQGSIGNDRVQIDLVGTRYGLASGQRASDGRVSVTMPSDFSPGNYRLRIASLDHPGIDTYTNYFAVTGGTSGTGCENGALFNSLTGYRCSTPGNNLPPSISGVSGPTTLKIGETGTWSVRASDPENGPLSYSVIWGDESIMASGGVASPTAAAIQQSVTFTHSYATAGTYYPTFIVTDNFGQTSQTRISVNVDWGNSHTPAISFFSPLSNAQWLANSDHTVVWIMNNNSIQPSDWITIRLLTSDNRLATGLMNIQAVNDGNEPVNLSRVPSGKYYFQIIGPTNYAKPQSFDSDIFTIINEKSSITIISPNGGETFQRGQTHQIRWNSNNVRTDQAMQITLANINQTELSRIDPQYIEQGVIASVTPYNVDARYIRPALSGLDHTSNTGYYNWTIPSNLPTGSSYYLYVGESKIMGEGDFSDQSFTILPAPVTP